MPKLNKMNNYVIYEPLGKGEFTEVHKGRKKKSIEFVILKSFVKSQKERIFNEVKILSSLKHESVIGFNYWYETRNHYWAIYEYVCGGDMRKIIEKDTGMKEDSLRVIASQLVEGLAFIHSQKVVFCDMKPSNIVFNEFAIPKYVDFASARLEADLHNETTSDIFYTAPEVLSKAGPYSFKSDVFGLGVLLFELGKGIRPFTGSTAEELVAEIRERRIPKIEGYSDQFARLMEKMLEADPTARASIEEVRNSPWMKRSETEKPKERLTEKFSDKLSVMTEKDSANQSKIMRSVVTDDADKKSVRSQNSLAEKYSLFKSNSIVEKGSPPLSATGKERHMRGLSDNLIKHKEMRKTNSTYDTTFEPLGSQKRKSGDVRSNRSPNTSQINDLDRSVSCLDESVEDANQKGSTALPYKITEDFVFPIPKDLFQVASERSMSQIIFNPEIEKFELADQGPCDIPLPTEREIFAEENAKQFILMAYKHLSSDARTQSKIALLDHMSRLSSSKTFANLIPESNFFNLLIRLLKAAKTKALKVSACTLTGLVLRHTERISVSFQSASLVEMLSENFGDSPDLVRSRSVAALGEFLFYLSYQPEGRSGERDPELPLLLFLKALSNSKDELTICYALKTMENITTVSHRMGPKFALQEFISVILGLLKLRTFRRLNFIRKTSLNILSNLLRIKPMLRIPLFEQEHLEIILVLLRSDNQKVIVAICNYLLVMFSEFSENLSKNVYEILPLYIKRLLGWLAKGDILLQTKIVLVFEVLLSANTRFYSLINDVPKFLLAAKKLGEVQPPSEQLQKKVAALNDYAIKVSNAFTSLTKLICIKFFNEFSQLLQTPKSPEATQQIHFCLNIVSLIIGIDYYKEHCIEPETFLQTLSVTHKCDAIFDSDMIDVLDTYLDCLQKLLTNSSWTTKLQTQILNIVLQPLIAAITVQKKPEVQTIQFKILVEIFNKSVPEELSDKWIRLSMAIFDFCVSLLVQEDPQMKLNALKICRSFLERKIVLTSSLETLKIIRFLAGMLSPSSSKEDETDIGNSNSFSLNIFALLFYFLADNSELISEYQSMKLFDSCVQMLVEFKQNEQINEFFEFLNLYLEIVHKKTKQEDPSSDLSLNGQTLSALLDYIALNSEAFCPFMTSELVNIFYYSLCIIAQSRQSKAPILTSSVNLRNLKFKELPLFKQEIDRPQVLKKIGKIEELLLRCAK